MHFLGIVRYIEFENLSLFMLEIVHDWVAREHQSIIALLP